MVQIKESVSGDKVYKKIDVRDLKSGESIIVSKKFATGRPNVLKNAQGSYTLYSCLVVYEGQEVYISLYEKDHNKYASVGGVDDKVKITRFVTLDDNEKKVVSLEFEAVN
jgi:hypothetical protein